MADRIIFNGKLPITDSGTGPTFSGFLQQREIDGTTKDEPINPIAFFEKDTATGLYLPPGEAADADVKKPRFRAPDLENLLESLKTIISDEDFAQEVTLKAIETLISDLESKDFTKETTLKAIETLINNLESKDFAKESTLESIRILIDSLDKKDYSKESTLNSLLSKITELDNKVDSIINEDGNVKSQQYGSIVLGVDPDDGTISQVNQQVFEGLSTDTKPTEGINLYDKFYENDTGDIYYWNKIEWVRS